MENEKSTESESGNVRYLKTTVDPSLYDARKEKSLNFGGGSGTSGGMTEDWKASVDTQLGQLHGDVRALLAAIIAAFIILAGGGWVIYSKLSDQSAAVQVELAKTSTRAESMDKKLDSIDQKLDALIMAQNSRNK